MKKIVSCLMALLGLNTACGQTPYTDMNVNEFAALIGQPGVQLLDVRTAGEYAEGHLAGARLADVKRDGFVDTVCSMLDTTKTVAVYCRSGRRSADAARQLAARGYRVVNLTGGILAWQAQGMPTTTDLPAFDADVCDTFTTSSGKIVKVRPLMHASLILTIDGSTVYIDPVGQLANRTIDYSPRPKAELILVTHEHADHLDPTAIATLTDEGTLLVTNERCARMLGYGREMANGDALDIDDLHLEAVPAYNTTAEHLKFHPKGRDNGFVLTYDGLRIYIAGDTEDIPEMANLRDIDIAFMPCNQPYTMTVQQLANAARMVKPKVLYPYHYGKTDISSLPAMLNGDGIEVRLRPWEE